MIVGSYRIEKEDWKRVTNKAKRTKLSLSFIIRELLIMWADGKIKIEIEA